MDVLLSSVLISLPWLCVYQKSVGTGAGENSKVCLSFLGNHYVGGNNLNKESTPLLGPLWYGLRWALIIVQQLILLSG